MPVWHAHRLDQLPPYLFAEINRRKCEALAAGRDAIDFGVGDPDTPTPDFIVERLAEAAGDPANHRYSLGGGKPSFRLACAEFIHRRFGVRVDPETHVVALIGSKEGIGHLPLAVLNPGEIALIPEPGYPVYTSATIFAGGVPRTFPLTAESGWLADLDDIPPDSADRARLLFLNYPNNPTGAVADRSFFERVVRFAQSRNILIAHDAAYSEIYFNDPPPSILQIDGALDCAVEFHSLSKTFNMTGWRIAFAVGNPDIIAALGKVKDNFDSGAFGAIQDAAVEALKNSDHPAVRAMADLYARRRDIVIEGLTAAGFEVEAPRAGFYVWARCPKGYTSMDFAARTLAEADVVVIPGRGFGTHGEGYFRIALTVEADRTAEAMERIRRVEWSSPAKRGQYAG